MSLALNILLGIWQLPQNLVALVLLAIYHKDAARLPGLTYKGIRYVIAPTFPGGVSLGNFVFIRDDVDDDPKGWDHELGHARQSRMLGPLYLIVIGPPSLCGNIYDRLFHTAAKGWTWEKSEKWYYNQPWEKWADKLGGVKR